jgi:hypothetical protein
MELKMRSFVKKGKSLLAIQVNYFAF